MTILPTPEWHVSPGLTDYAAALADMEERAAAMHAGNAGERIWLLEHPPLYTAGTSADPAELLDPRFPVFDDKRENVLGILLAKVGTATALALLVGAAAAGRGGGAGSAGWVGASLQPDSAAKRARARA